MDQLAKKERNAQAAREYRQRQRERDGDGVRAAEAERSKNYYRRSQKDLTADKKKDRKARNAERNRVYRAKKKAEAQAAVPDVPDVPEVQVVSINNFYTMIYLQIICIQYTTYLIHIQHTSCMYFNILYRVNNIYRYSYTLVNMYVM